ncbi:hypothetical protein [Apilactobacillus xinyiensis]|nr:hypothetical protein [Apilactobacillus xinyiensis]
MRSETIKVKFNINPEVLQKLKKHPDWCKQPERLKKYIAKNIHCEFG